MCVAQTKFFEQYFEICHNCLSLLPAERRRYCSSSCTYSQCGFYPFIFAWKFGIKIRIAHSHSTRYSDNWLKGICNYLLICLMKIFVTDRFACGNDAANFLFGKHNLSNTYIFHNAIDTSIFQFSVDRRRNKRKDLNLSGNLVLGHVGNMFKLKIIHSLLMSLFQ